MSKTISLEKKLLLVAGTLTLLFIALSISYFLHVRHTVIEQRRCALEPRIHFIGTIIEASHQDFLDGKLDLAQAQAKAIEQIHQINLESEDYVFIFNDDYLLLESINNSEMKNKNVKEDVDINGVKLYQLIRHEAVYRENDGYSRYFYYANLSRQQQEKISYTQYFKPWGWSYGKGVYIKDVDASILSMMTSH